MDKHDESTRVSSDEAEPVREGDVLGLGGSAVPKSPSDPVTEFDEESEARRHARARGEDEETVERRTNLKRTPGATGIDMGAGGTGTDIE